MKIYIADNDYYVVAENMETAVEKYHDARKQYPENISIEVDDGSVFVTTEIAMVSISKSPDDSDGTVSPLGNIFLLEGESITMQATDGTLYLFDKYTDADGTLLSSDPLFTYTSTGISTEIIAVFKEV